MLDPAPQYRCDNLLRARRLAADAVFAGIQFVESPVMAAPSGSHEDLRQRVLLLHLPQPVQTGGSDILVQGGVRVTDLPNIWAVPADALFSGVGLPSTVTSDQRTQILAVLPTTAA